ncbi:MAG: DUF3099 domain-containing protein [Rothia sp. (in: high G+C Gram-positive bacteria)]|nr:DUF3099 domain-containing protein [Rothia sp. (in: high G+C Gram-positive bacteria)]
MSKKYWTAEDLAAAGYSGGVSDEVYSITDAVVPQSEGVGARARSYALKMFLRIVCIIAAVMVEGVWQWVFLVGAAVIPWLAVVVANGSDRQHGSGFSAFLPEDQRLAIAAAQAARAERSARTQQSSSGVEQQGGEVAPATDDGLDRILVIDGEVLESHEG